MARRRVAAGGDAGRRGAWSTSRRPGSTALATRVRAAIRRRARAPSGRARASPSTRSIPPAAATCSAPRCCARLLAGDAGRSGASARRNRARRPQRRVPRCHAAWRSYLRGELVTAVSRVVEVPASVRRQELRPVRRAVHRRVAADRPDAASMRAASSGPSPYGLIGLLTAGAGDRRGGRRAAAAHGARRRRRARATGRAPASSSTRRSCSRCTARCRGSRGAQPADVLLDVTPVRATEDVHEVVGRIQEGAARILDRRARARGEGDDGLRHGAFGGMSEYCGARRHRRLGGGAGLQLPKAARAAGRGDRGERCRASASAARSRPRRPSASATGGATAPRSRPP